MRPLNIPPSVLDDLPVLLKAKPKRNYNPLHYLWIGWEQFAYFWAPANNCQYCWTLRLFIVGFVLGMQLAWWFPWTKFW